MPKKTVHHHKKHMDYAETLRKIGRHRRFHTVSFNKNREKLHQSIIGRALRNRCAPADEFKRPKAVIVIGGAGSGKSRVCARLNTDLRYVACNSDTFKQYLVKHEITQHPSRNQGADLEETLHITLQSEAVRIRQEAIFQATCRHADVMIETVGTNTIAIQSSINALHSKNYEIELHLVDTKEEIAIDRVATRNQRITRKVPTSYARYSNRAARATYEKLARKNHRVVTTHRWNNDSDEPTLDNHAAINAQFERWIRAAHAARTELLTRLNHRSTNQPHVTAHLKQMQALLSLPPAARQPEAMLMSIVSDIAIFPELYHDQPREQLHSLFGLIDRSDLQVYFVSIRRKGPTKTHGGVIIASPKCQTGISMAAAGEPRRGKIRLPVAFCYRLYNALCSTNPWPKAVTRSLGTQKYILSLLMGINKRGLSRTAFDAYALTQLIKHCAPGLLDEFQRRVLFNAKYNTFELWSKPRSALQHKDTSLFNRHFSSQLARRTHSCAAQTWGHMHHGITNNLAIRRQSSVKTSTVLKRWLDIEANKARYDEQRKIVYRPNTVWHYNCFANEHHGGNCNTVSVYLLGKTPVAASAFNSGTSKAVHFTLPTIPEEQATAGNEMKPAERVIHRTTRNHNRYDALLKEAHLAKLIIHNPATHQDAVLRVNKYILQSLNKLDKRAYGRLIISTKLHFNEYDHHHEKVDTFLQRKLRSTDPKDLFRALPFHKSFFENIRSRPMSSSTAQDRLQQWKMRPGHLFGKTQRAKQSEKRPLTTSAHAGVGALRMHTLCPLELHKGSFNAYHERQPAYRAFRFNAHTQPRLTTTRRHVSARSSYQQRVIQQDAPFCAGTSGTMTTTLPFIFRKILTKDPIAQEAYIMAQAAAMAYVGHHSMLEAILPLQYMGEDCPARFKDVQYDSQFYEKVMTRQFKHHINHARTASGQTLRESHQETLNADKTTVATHLSSPAETRQLSRFRVMGQAVAKTPLERERQSLARLLSKKIKNLTNRGSHSKCLYLHQLKAELLRMENPSTDTLQSLRLLLSETPHNNVGIFEGLTAFSRFKSRGRRVTETQYLVERVLSFTYALEEQLETSSTAHAIEHAPATDDRLALVAT